jgi:hypothetical protein
MRPLVFALLLIPSSSALAANDGPEGAIASVARATGMSNQFSARCGLDPDLLKRHKAKFEVEANAANARLPAGHEVDINAEFAVGSDEANRYFDAVKDTPSRAMVCQAMEAQVTQALSGPGVLTLPVR